VTGIHAKLSREEVAALVCTTLESHGISVVLCGGAVASIYAQNEFESLDLDFVPTGIHKNVSRAMRELGFSEKGRHWVHPDTRFGVDFSPGPVMADDRPVAEFAERSTRAGDLRLLHPTECVIDRLAGYYFWNDPQCLDQAVAVATAQRRAVDLARIEAWSRRRRMTDRFETFREELDP
jgi:hypothetical protein